MTRSLLIAVTLAIASSSPALACGKSYKDFQLENLARAAIAEDAETAKGAIAKLRSAGPAGLAAMFAVYGDRLLQPMDQAASDGPQRPDLGERKRIRNAMDDIGAQRYCHASGLYWYTDFEQAQAAAHETGKPMLSLRLLGKLTDEYSCANSRFFRTTLYANREVSKYLKDHFILHWQSVRPAPQITIDFGDGRQIRSTVTGNSVHHVLAASGKPIDALPGLYGPAAFLEGLRRAESLHASLAGLQDEEANLAIRKHHQARQLAILAKARSDLKKIRPDDAASSLNLQSDDSIWSELAQLHGDAVLDAATVSLISEENPTAIQAGEVAVTKSVVETPLVRMLRSLRHSIALDTLRNEYVLHRDIHGWFAAGEVTDLTRFNDRIYSDLFLTPSSDPWLGLISNDDYKALVNSGVVMAGASRSPAAFPVANVDE